MKMVPKVTKTHNRKIQKFESIWLACQDQSLCMNWQGRKKGLCRFSHYLCKDQVKLGVL